MVKIKVNKLRFVTVKIGKVPYKITKLPHHYKYFESQWNSGNPKLKNMVLNFDSLPPIEVKKLTGKWKGNYIVCDGNHRSYIAMKLGKKEINAKIFGQTSKPWEVKDVAKYLKNMPEFE